MLDQHTHELKEDATLTSNAVTNATVVAKANERPEFVAVEFALRDGVITDYPLDSYTTNFFFRVKSRETARVSTRSRSGLYSTTSTRSSS